MNRVIIIVALLCFCLPAHVKCSNIGVVAIYYAFDELRDYCKWKHHGSYVNVDSQFQQWKTDYDIDIKAAFTGLKKEAETNESKAQKLKVLDSTMRNMWGQRFIEMTDNESAYLCFSEGQAKDYFTEMIQKELK